MQRSANTSTVILMNLQMEPRAKVEPGSGKHNCIYALSEGLRVAIPA